MIEGLKLTLTGEQLIAKLNSRIRAYEADGADRTKSLRQIDVLTLIRDHIERHEVYRLGEYDLRFADLLPEEEWIDCGCLDRWRIGEHGTTEDLKELGAGPGIGAETQR